jgi:hypothetical protein
MITEQIKELEATKAKLASLEQSIELEMEAELAGLPVKYGFESMQALIKRLKSIGGVRAKKTRAPKAKSKVARPAAGQKRARATITEEMKLQVKALTEAGKTGPEIAVAVGISMPSVQNIKKAFGLVKARA